jgi:Kef-type K+ transport system membrane component KefB
MRKVSLYSALLILGLAGSQILPGLVPHHTAAKNAIELLTMFCLAFIMIHVGYEFEIDKSKLKEYGWDYVVAATAAAFPWLFCAVYFVFVMASPETWRSWDLWTDSLLTARFAAPTSAGVLFAMLAAAALATSWVFKKARVLAIFDDLDTVLLMIPLKMLIVGLKWQLAVLVPIMVVQLWLAWKYLHAWRIPVSWLWVMGYAAAIAIGSEVLYVATKIVPVHLLRVPLEDVVPIHVEVLLPAFVVGCVMARPRGQDPHLDDSRPGHQEGPESPAEQRIASFVTAGFMVLVGLSLPALTTRTGSEPTDWGMVAVHVVFITLLSNLGKMFPAVSYRWVAHWRERLALAVGMFPRGEVGAGVLVVSLAYEITGLPVTVAMLSLALNLALTGGVIVGAKKLIVGVPRSWR